MKIVLQEEYQEWLSTAEVLMKDDYGEKVLRLADGNFVKLFRVKRRLSSARIRPYSRRFVRNAHELVRLRVPTVNILDELRIPSIGKTGVLYAPLEGRTVRDIAEAGELDEKQVERLGEFFAALHQNGILFRSNHLGNLLLCPNGEFGLIDISDMTIFPWPLWVSTRLRNFNHLFRYTEDLALLTTVGKGIFLDGYLSTLHSGLSKRMNSKLKLLQEEWLRR